jgi:hypothetical protein
MMEREILGKLGRFAGFGLTMGVTMLLCGALGVFLDRHIGTTPVITVILFLGGGASAFWYGMVNFLK